MKKQITVIIFIVAGLLLAASVAMAQGMGRDRGEGRQGMGRVAYGVITSISDTQLVIEPQIPPQMAERMAEMDRPLPELPDEVVFEITADTQFHLGDDSATIADLSVGDTVVVAGGPGEGGNPVARRVADPETARRFIQQRMGRGEGMRGEGMRGGMRNRPVFGTIKSISAGSMTVSIEIPDFIQAKLDGRGIELPADMPSEVTVAIAERTRYAQGGEVVDGNPFSIGDKVAVMAGPGDDESPVARVITDWETVEERMAGQCMNPDGPGAGKRSAGRRGRKQ